jgi:hypothetical protein
MPAQVGLRKKYGHEPSIGGFLHLMPPPRRALGKEVILPA